MWLGDIICIFEILVNFYGPGIYHILEPSAPRMSIKLCWCHTRRLDGLLRVLLPMVALHRTGIFHLIMSSRLLTWGRGGGWGGVSDMFLCKRLGDAALMARCLGGWYFWSGLIAHKSCYRNIPVYMCFKSRILTCGYDHSNIKQFIHQLFASCSL